jgi:hypothetical protein
MLRVPVKLLRESASFAVQTLLDLEAVVTAVSEKLAVENDRTIAIWCSDIPRL